MAPEQRENSKSAQIDAGLIAKEFCAIENLNQFYTENNWDGDYRQLEPGILSSQVSAREIGRIGIFREIISHRISGSAKSPDGFFSIVISMRNDEFCINGYRIDAAGLLLIPPKSDLEISACGRSDAVTIQISTEMLGNYSRAIGGDVSLVETEQISSYRVDRNIIEPIRRMVDEVSLRPLHLNGVAAIESVLATDMSRLLTRPVAKKIVGDPYHRLTKRRVVARAREYIYEHMGDIIRVTDLCAYCGVSLSTLERMFKHELDIGPSEYIQASRLHEVRRHLLCGKVESRTIAEIAMRCGFTHMGRFSQRYRTHFGRLPSEERSVANNPNRRNSNTEIQKYPESQIRNTAQQY